MWQLRHLLISVLAMLLVGIIGAQDPGTDRQKPGLNDPELAVEEDAIRVQPLDPDKSGSWILMPGYNELGSPCFSRDGRWVAFDAYKEGYNNGRPEAWIAHSDGTGLKKLTNGAVPRWSPDGKRLLFIRGSEVEPNGEPDIYVIKPDGTDERKLGHGRWPDWSPDGKKIAFSRGGLPGGGAKIGAAVSISNADGSDEKYIADGDCPSWSPDGRKIAICFRQEETPPEIRILDLKTNESTTIGIGWFRANWMPNGRAVVANGRVGMVKLSAEGRITRRAALFSQFEGAASPCASLDGELFVFTARRPGKGGGP